MGILSFFKKNTISKFQKWREFGSYQANYSSFGNNIYKSDIVKMCVRPISEHTSKANARCTDKNIENILNYKPNIYMNGKDFLAKCRNYLEIKNTAFIYIMRDNKGNACGFYPVPYASFEALEYNNKIYIRFFFNGDATRELVASWDDLAILRKDYFESDFAGDDNRAILQMLETISITNQGVANAVKATSNLRGIIKSKQAMLAPEDVKRQQREFVEDYINLENGSGIASLDASMEFIPVTLNPSITSPEQMKEFRENIYRYFGVSDAIVMSNYTEYELEAFYSARIEPFLVALSLELTQKVFTERERRYGAGASIVFESNRLQYASNSTKLAMVSMVDRGALTPNEWRMMFNLAPVDGGDVPIRRLDTAEVNSEPTEAQEGEDND